MAPEIARVEYAPAGARDQKHIGIEGAVIGQDRSNCERADGERLRAAVPGHEAARRRMAPDLAGKRDQPRRCCSCPNRPLGGQLGHEAVMILMRMTDQHSRWPRHVKARRQEAVRPLRRIERSAGVEDEAGSVRMGYLDAATADLLRAAMNDETQAHGQTLMSEGLPFA